MAKQLQSHIRDFLTNLETEKQRSDYTLRNYRLYLARFADWHGKKKKPDTITPACITRYKKWLGKKTDAHGEFMQPQTQNYHLIALRALLKFLKRQDVDTLTPHAITLYKNKRRPRQSLTDDEIIRLLHAPFNKLGYEPADKKRASRQELIALRDCAVLTLLLATGLRVSDMAKLKRRHIDTENSTLHAAKKQRLAKNACKRLRHYLAARQDKNPFLFVPHDKCSGMQKQLKQKNGGYVRNDRPLTPRSIQRLIERAAKGAGITQHVTPHTLRHAYAYTLLEDGVDLKTLQHALGHETYSSTKALYGGKS